MEKTQVVEELNITFYDKSKFNVFRLDGHKFSNLTKKNFEKPFDTNFNIFMKECAKFIFEKYNFQLCFVGSDEISLVYYPITEDKPDSQLPFNGKDYKLLSLLSSCISSQFSILSGLYNEFDCRHFYYNTLEQVKEYLISRRKYTVKNSKMMLAQHNFFKNKLNKISSNEAIKMLKNELNIDYYEVVEESIRRGIMIYKKKEKMKKIINKKGEDVEIEFERKCPIFEDSIEIAIENNTA